MLTEIVFAIAEAGGRAFQVGGSVRDSLLGLACKDLDVEVFQISAVDLARILSRFGRVDEVGVSFGVMKLKTADGTEFDFTLPRRENKIGQGHRGFQVEVDHAMTMSEAAARRDFTINAIYRCPQTGELHDPHGGVRDLERRVLRATSPHFAEDPLRVLRGMQFAARFDLTLDEQTAELARSLSPEYGSLAVERLWGEWSKWASRSIVPSRGLQLLAATGWLEHYPEMTALPGVPQDPQWHPEGDVWIHTLHVCDAAARIADRDELDTQERTILLLAALCHDLGKPATTEFLEGHWRARGHCDAGVPLSRAFLERIGCPEAIIEVIEPLVAEHLVHAQHEMNPRVVRRLAERLGKATIAQLVRLIEADMNGRPPLPGGIPPEVMTMIELAHQMNVEQARPKPMILGRHLIALGHTPDVWFGTLLKQCFEAQLDGTIATEDQGVALLASLVDDFYRNIDKAKSIGASSE